MMWLVFIGGAAGVLTIGALHILDSWSEWRETRGGGGVGAIG
jgi:hypothetical protein